LPAKSPPLRVRFSDPKLTVLLLLDSLPALAACTLLPRAVGSEVDFPLSEPFLELLPWSAVGLDASSSFCSLNFSSLI
jgi:hypothetical protein